MGDFQARNYGNDFNQAFTGMGNFILGKQKQEDDLLQRGIENKRADASADREERGLRSRLAGDAITQEGQAFDNKLKKLESKGYVDYATDAQKANDDIALLESQQREVRPTPEALDAVARVHAASPLLPDDPLEYKKSAVAGKYILDTVGQMGQLNNNKKYSLLREDDPDSFASAGYLFNKSDDIFKIDFENKPEAGAGDVIIHRKVDGKEVAKKYSVEDLQNKAAAAINASALTEKVLANSTPEDIQYLEGKKKQTILSRSEWEAKNKREEDDRYNAKKSSGIIANIDSLREPEPVDAAGKPIVGKRSPFNAKLDIIKAAAESGASSESVTTLYNAAITESALKEDNEAGARTAVSMMMKSNIKGNTAFIKELQNDFNPDGSPKAGGRYKTAKDAKEVMGKIMELNATNWRNEQDNIAKVNAVRASQATKSGNIDYNGGLKLRNTLAARYASARVGKVDPETGEPFTLAGIQMLAEQIKATDAQLSQLRPGHIGLPLPSAPQAKPLGAAVQWVKKGMADDAKGGTIGGNDSGSGFINNIKAGVKMLTTRKEADYVAALAKQNYSADEIRKIINEANGKTDPDAWMGDGVVPPAIGKPMAAPLGATEQRLRPDGTIEYR